MEMLLVDGRLKKRQAANRQPEQCRVFKAGHHVEYIDWTTYEENQRMTRRNSANWEADESMSAIRAGQGLLVGCCAAAIAAVRFMCATGVAPELTRAI